MLGFETMEQLLLPYGKPHFAERNCAHLPKILSCTGLERVHFDSQWNADDHTHTFSMRGTNIMSFGIQFDSPSMFVQKWSTYCKTFRKGCLNLGTIASIVLGQPPALEVTLTLSPGAVAPTLHGCLCVVLAIMNPLLFLEEIVSLGLSITMVYLRDNRTMDAADMMICQGLLTECRSHIWQAAGEECHVPCLSQVKSLPTPRMCTPKLKQPRPRGKKRKRRPSSPRTCTRTELPPTSPPPISPKETVHETAPWFRSFHRNIRRVNDFARGIGYANLLQCNRFLSDEEN